MNTILIISPHFPPSNLAAVHRSRLFAQHLPAFGWSPTILTVDEKYYEERLDWNLAKLLPKNLRIEKVKAFKVTKPRLVGDIGLRSFFQLYKRAKQLIIEEKFDFLYIPIPSFYVALLGRWLNHSTGIKYGVDYIDPWVHHFPGSDKTLSRHWFSTKISALLEPIAVKRASLITGVAEGYYKGVFDRNPFLQNNAICGAMPYGGEAMDHQMINELAISPYLFKKNPEKLQLVYAGAMLPKAYGPLEKILESIASNKEDFKNLEIHFIGTGKIANEAGSYNIKPLAEKYNLWSSSIFEYPQRIPYVDVLIHLNTADGVFILGSTEPHYTPSKVYQAVLSGKPIFAVLHGESTAVQIIRDSNTGLVLSFPGQHELGFILKEFPAYFSRFVDFCRCYKDSSINMETFNNYSAKAITQKLAVLLEKAVEL